MKTEYSMHIQVYTIVHTIKTVRQEIVIQHADRQTDSGVVIRESRFTLWARNPKND